VSHVPGGGTNAAALSDDDPNPRGGLERVSPDGSYLLLTTPLALDPAADGDTDTDAYRYSQGEGWTCASCQQPAVPSAGPAASQYTRCCDSFNPYANPSHEISEDGQRIFFIARDGLLPTDTNGEAGCPLAHSAPQTAWAGNAYSCQDVYEWRAPGAGGCDAADPDYFARNGGCLSLVTGGTGTGPSVLIGPTASAQSAFFLTGRRLVGFDEDNATDIYVARVNGGFPEPAPVEPPCDLGAGACEGPGTGASLTTGAATPQIDGPPDPKPIFSKKCPRGKRRVVRNGRTRCVAKKRKRGNRAAKHNRRAQR
jgi:hypothetical protein